MILNRRKLGGVRKPTSFHRGGALYPALDFDSLKQWTLTNGRVSFTFLQDPEVGVRLYSWQESTFGSPIINSSKSLWSLGMIESYQYTAPPNDGFKWNTYVVHPTGKNFVEPATIPVYDDVSKTKSFTFLWNVVQYDNKRQDLTCRVTLTASLNDDEDSLDLNLVVDADQSYTDFDLTQFNSSIVHYLGFPTITIKKSATESENEDTILTNPTGIGYTYHNPHKWLRAPRYQREAFQFNHRATRCYAAGQPGAPDASLLKYNYGSPGGMTIPVMVLGNKTSKEGTVFYSLDQQGTNAKPWQFYFDDKSLHIKTCHMSDHAVDPYGVGGYHNASGARRPFSMRNAPTWSFRIHPFKSPTRWVDWRGHELYRKTVVHKQEEWGWIPESFYNRQDKGVMNKAIAEMPMTLNMYGYTTGTADNITGAAGLYEEIYRECVSPNITGQMTIPIHYQCISLNGHPNRGTDPDTPSNAYWGWEPWAASGTGVSNVGPDAYRAPDFDFVNDNHTGAFANLVEMGHMPFVYNIFPYTLTTGSLWLQGLSGIDMVAKGVADEFQTITNDDYSSWAISGSSPGLYGKGYATCLHPDPCKRKNEDIAGVLGTYGVSAYHDTFGLFGRGCMAKEHKYYDTGVGAWTETSHPRSPFSRFTNSLHLEWMSGWIDHNTATYAQNFTTGGFPNAIPKKDWVFAQSTEHLCDLNLGQTPMTLLYEPLGAIFNAYFNPTGDARDDTVLNVAAGTVIDNLSDSAIEALLPAYPSDYFACTIDPPNWIQRCPMYQLVYSDRVVQNEWAAIYSTNGLPNFWSAVEPTGRGKFGQMFQPTGTEEIRRQDWAAFSLTQWPYSNRMSVWHVDNQVNYTAPSYGVDAVNGAINNDDREVLYSGVWSGYTTNLIQRMFRVQAYNPDYMYHGFFQHPLDDYDVEHSAADWTTIGMFKHMPANLKSTTGRVDGDERVPHFVREHRSNGNLLIVAANWHTGTSSFTGVFDPSTYGITNGYQVYSLDVNTVNHGTKTLEQVVEAEANFTIDVDLDQFEFRVYEIEINAEQLDNEVFSDLKTDYSPVAYGYSVQSVATDSLSVAYSYGTSTLGELADPQEGFKAPATQEILNNMPQWMKMRQDTGSVGWKMTNSWAMGLERVLETAEEGTNNLNIISAETHSLSEVSFVDVTDQGVLEDKTPRNLLFNSSFSIKDAARTWMPAGWEKYDVTSNTFLSDRSTGVTCCSLVATNGKIKAGQGVELGNIMVSKMYASVYVLCDATNTDITLHVSVENIDATNHAAQAKITNRSSEWVRLVLPIDVNNQVYRVNFSITANCDAEVSICAPQLEIGGLTAWSKSSKDVVPYLPYTSNFNLVYAHSSEQNSRKIAIHPIADEQLFIDANIPTRLEKAPTPTRDIEPYITSAFGRRVDQLGEVVRTEFSVADDKVIERAISPTPFDIYGEYYIKDLRFYEELAYGTRDDSRVILEPITVGVRDSILYALCKETFNSNTRYVVKVIDPRVPPNGEDYLESMIDFELDLNLDKTFSVDGQVDEEVYSISFSDVEPTYMIVTTTNNISYYYQLHFDYYYFNSSKNRLYTIESYPEANISVI